MKRVAISQSNYIPWKGYFDLIAYVDEFVLFDDMQFTKRDWRNRNLIKTPTGLQWLTVPVVVKGRYDQKIKDTEISGTEWINVHLRSFRANYARAAFFGQVMQLVEPVYHEGHKTISLLNRRLIEILSGHIGCHTLFRDSSEFALLDDKSARLADICAQAGASTYVSGPAAKAYLDETPFRERGIEVEWFDYGDYPKYPQLWGEFEHGVSIVDLLFNCGPEAARYMKHAGR